MKSTVKKQGAKPKPRFENGSIVYLDFGRGEECEKVTVKKSHFQKLTRIFMYSFEEKGDMVVGECYLKNNPSDRKLRMGECIHDQGEDAYADNLFEGVIDNEMRAEGRMTYAGNRTVLFFRPDREFLQWIKEYAAGRIILDVGCGASAQLLQSLFQIQQAGVGIEPFIEAKDMMELNRFRIEHGESIINIFPKPVEECGNFIKAMGSKALMIIARPCHSGFVENALDLRPEGMEALYITIPQNLTKYNDMGKWKKKAVKLDHKGFSPDNEVVYSIK